MSLKPLLSFFLVANIAPSSKAKLPSTKQETLILFGKAHDSLGDQFWDISHAHHGDFSVRPQAVGFVKQSVCLFVPQR